jgi:hypothetical protein
MEQSVAGIMQAVVALDECGGASRFRTIDWKN